MRRSPPARGWLNKWRTNTKKTLNQVQDDIFLYFSWGIILCFEKSEYFAFFDAYDILNPNLARGSIAAKRGSKSPKIKDPLVVGLLFFLNLSLVAIVFSRQNEWKLKPKENSSDPWFFQESHICEVYQSKSPTPKKEWERWDYREEDILHKSSMR